MDSPSNTLGRAQVHRAYLCAALLGIACVLALLRYGVEAGVNGEVNSLVVDGG